MGQTVAVVQNIQVLRFLAAFLVALHHTLPPNVHPAHYANIPAFVTHISLFGFAGLDLFFVISGYIMAQTTQWGEPGPRAGAEFVTRRFLRIYTGYWPVFLLVLAMSTAWGVWQDPNISNWASFWLLPQYKYKLNVAWTLTYELYFYLLVGCMLVFTRRHTTAIMAVLFALLLVRVLVQLAQGFYEEANVPAIRLLPDMLFTSPLILEFMAGFLLQRLLSRHPRQRVLPWLLFTMAAWALAWYAERLGAGMAAFLGFPIRALCLGGASLGLLALAVITPEWRGWPMRLMQKLGDASYALYLLHIPLLVILYGKLFPLVDGLLWWCGGKVTLLLYLLTCLVVSWAYFRWVETPLHRLSRKLVARLFPERAKPDDVRPA